MPKQEKNSDAIHHHEKGEQFDESRPCKIYARDVQGIIVVFIVEVTKDMTEIQDYRSAHTEHMLPEDGQGGWISEKTRRSSRPSNNCTCQKVTC